MASVILLITAFFNGRQFEPFIALYVPLLENIPLDSFSDEMDTTYDVVMTSENTGFIREVVRTDAGSNNSRYTTTIIYFEIKTKSMYPNEPLYAYGGKKGIHIKNSFSYVSYKSYNLWSSRYKPFGVNYRSFLNNYSINPDDILYSF